MSMRFTCAVPPVDGWSWTLSAVEHHDTHPFWSRIMFKRIVVLAAAAVLSFSALAYEKSRTIVDVAAGNPDFSTLVAAVKAAGLADTLSGEGPFTVFAPTNEAFAKLPAGTVEDLLKPENKDKLIAVLTYHVVPGKVMAADVSKLSSAKTVNGKNLRIDSSAGVRIDSANVTATDVAASNGVIHVVDSVILP
jgi:uncharacterized surface protein with fasciclin (FAS1) repeats